MEQMKLYIIVNSNGTKGIKINVSGNVDYVCKNPAYLEIKEDSGDLKCYEEGYLEVEQTSQGYKCLSYITTTNGSSFTFYDHYLVNDGNNITFNREVKVTNADSRDTGFSTSFGLQETGYHVMNDYDIFVPGIWYRKNKNVVKHGFASDYSDSYYYIRATRMALPYVQMFNTSSNNYISMMHIDPTPSTGIENETTDWLVDSSLQYPSLGIKAYPVPSIQYMFPGSEGEKTYIDNSKRWARRSHPLTGNINHKYQLIIYGSTSEDVYKGMRDCWRNYFRISSPEIVTADLQRNYQIGVELIDTYCQEYNGVMGIPFWATVPEGTVCDISFQMGFVGQQLQCAYQLMKYGFENNIDHMIEKGNKIVDFWVEKSAENSILPQVWYNAFPATFKEDYDVYTRTLAEGMEGVLNSYQINKRYTHDNKKWLDFCITYGDWLVENQNNDGSYYRSYTKNGEAVHKGKFNSSNVIRFLINLYWETENVAYLNSAVKAGDFCYDYIYLPMQYVGGTADNDNTIDKEAGMIAVYAFMTLYDATKSEKWLKAATGAADFIETWIYSWSYPVLPKKGNAVFDKVNFTGLSLIATGHSHSDVMMAYMPFDYYRLYLLTNDEHYYEIARYLSMNTKQTTDWDGKLGHVYPGLLEESGELALQYHNGLGRWLPWCTIAEIEPLTRFKEWFGFMDVNEIEGLSIEEKLELNKPGRSSWLSV